MMIEISFYRNPKAARARGFVYSVSRESFLKPVYWKSNSTAVYEVEDGELIVYRVDDSSWKNPRVHTILARVVNGELEEIARISQYGVAKEFSDPELEKIYAELKSSGVTEGLIIKTLSEYGKRLTNTNDYTRNKAQRLINELKELLKDNPQAIELLEKLEEVI